MAVNKPIVHHLLNRIKEFNEWAQCIVLELVARYRPSEQQETFDIMNLLEERDCATTHTLRMIQNELTYLNERNERIYRSGCATPTPRSCSRRRRSSST